LGGDCSGCIPCGFPFLSCRSPPRQPPTSSFLSIAAALLRSVRIPAFPPRPTLPVASAPVRVPARSRPEVPHAHRSLVLFRRRPRRRP
jgi:hypothetical protein